MSDPAASPARHPGLLARDEAVLVVVDVQEKLLRAIHGGEGVAENCRRLVEGAGLLGIPVLATEQYPRGLGPTTPELRQALEAAGASLAEKMTFSCAGCDAFLAALDASGRRQVVLSGIETHVCVLQTALDLLQAGLRVHVPADAVGSRAEANRLVALDRLRAAGGIVTTTESVLFEALGTAADPEFKSVTRLIR